MKRKINLYLYLLVIGLTLICSGCAQKSIVKKPLLSEDAYQLASDKSTDLSEQKIDTNKDKFEGDRKREEKSKVTLVQIPDPLIMEIKKIKSFNEEGTGEPEFELKLPKEGDVNIMFEGLPIYDFINLVFGQILHQNYTISQDIQNLVDKITINMTDPMSPERFFYLVLALLKDYNVDVDYQKGIFVISTSKSKVKEEVKPFNLYIGHTVPSLPPKTKITQIVPTYYIGPNEIFPFIGGFTRGMEGVRLEILNYTNAFIISGSIGDIEKIVNLIQILDKPYFVEKKISLFYLDYISSKDFDDKLKEILNTLGIPVAKSRVDFGIITLPIENINALLIVSPKKEWVDIVFSWKERLDTLESLGDERHLFIYRPENRSAGELVDLLQPFSSGKDEVTKGEKEKVGKQQKTEEKQKGATVSIKSGRSFEAILDKGRNAIIISAYPSDYKELKNMLDQLDSLPKQVLIEVTIAEITLTNQLQFGLEWYLKHESGDFTGELRTLGGLGVGGAGLLYSLTETGDKFRAIFNTFATKGLINIVSTPRIVVLDGREATINVGTEVPVVTSETTASDVLAGTATQPSILRNIQYRSTGVILSVKPVVNSENILTLEINQQLSEAQTNNVSSIDSPLILNRSIATILTIESGKTVLLGGLISENRSTDESKIPILGDIPIIGHLFRVDSKGRNKTELIILVTPYIIKNTDELERVTKEFKKGLSMFR